MFQVLEPGLETNMLGLKYIKLKRNYMDDPKRRFYDAYTP